LKNLAVTPGFVAPGQKLTYSPVKQGALIVSTTAADGSEEANKTPYFLNYELAATDPGVILIKSNASQNVWPDTKNCLDIALQ